MSKKRFGSILLVIALLFPLAVAAQAAHQVILTWVAPPDVIPSSTYNVYRASGACPLGGGIGTLTYAKLNASPITSLTYTDNTVTVGTYCYYATQVQNVTESGPSNTALAPVKPNTVTVTIVVN